MMSVIRRTKACHVFTGIERDYLEKSVSKNVPVKPIDSWSRGIHYRLLVGSTFGPPSPGTFTRNGKLDLTLTGEYLSLLPDEFTSQFARVQLIEDEDGLMRKPLKAYLEERTSLFEVC
ncbi:unnamed protein product [Protopolystoma xenopodis]|uniref:Uncharacterized protein n=1 Tax=Protopolystoma xenopodis TaxID=117903 RepID=A0A448WAW6_9PLAT|nr:unnamed protein product [Protopolystoma xenopodis]